MPVAPVAKVQKANSTTNQTLTSQPDPVANATAAPQAAAEKKDEEMSNEDAYFANLKEEKKKQEEKN